MTDKVNAYRIRRRAAWMKRYEDKLVSIRPELTGKVDWDTAVFMFNRGDSAEEAAKRTAVRES